MSSANAAEMQTESIAKELSGVKVLLVAPSLAILGGQSVQADLLLRNLRAEGVAADLLPINPVPWWPLNYLARVKYVRTLIVSILYVASLLFRVWRYDVIHVFSASYFSFILAPTPALLIATLYHKKTILNYRSGEAEDHFTRWGKSIFWTIRLADKIIVPSGFLVEVFGRLGFRAESIFNISDFSAFQYRERRVVTPHILVARNLEPLYDIETSIRAYAVIKSRYSAATLTITGYGSDERRLKSLVCDLNIQDVTFTGRVERSHMPELFQRADIFLNSSVIDNMPVAIIEAFYAGLPVVTTDVGGIPYIVRDRESGLLTPKRDVNALAAALGEAIDNADLRQKIIDGGRAFAQECSWQRVKWQWAKAYRELADAR
jgi:glycosyltransferase involved in cell wall biosynthesis